MNCVACKSALASVWCCADKAALCARCDVTIHSANALARAHKRTPMCELCKRSPAVIFCQEDAANLCRTCDVEVHSANPLPHTRVPLEDASLPAPVKCEDEAASSSRAAAQPQQCQHGSLPRVSSSPSASAAVVPELLAGPSGAAPADAGAAGKKDDDDFLDFELGGWLDAGFDLESFFMPVDPAQAGAAGDDGLVPTLSGAVPGGPVVSMATGALRASSSGVDARAQQQQQQTAHAQGQQQVPVMPPVADPLAGAHDFDEFLVPSFDMSTAEASLGAGDDMLDLLAPAPGFKRPLPTDEVDHLLAPPAKRAAHEQHMMPSSAVQAQIRREAEAALLAAQQQVVPQAPDMALQQQGDGQSAFMPVVSMQSLLPPVVKPSPEQLAAAKAADAAANAAYQASAQAALLAGGANLTREQRVARYREKRKNRKFEKTIRYASRKAYAEVRPRIKGRFATREEVAAWKLAHGITDENFIMPATITLD